MIVLGTELDIKFSQSLEVLPDALGDVVATVPVQRDPTAKRFPLWILFAPLADVVLDLPDVCVGASLEELVRDTIKERSREEALSVGTVT